PPVERHAQVAAGDRPVGAGHLGRAGAAAGDLGRPLGVAAEQVVGVQRQRGAVVEDQDAERGPRPLVRHEGALDEGDAAHRAVGRARVVEVVVLAVDAVDERAAVVVGLLLLAAGHGLLLLLRRRAHRRLLLQVLRRRPHGQVLRRAHERRAGLVVLLLLGRRAHGGGLLVVLGHGAVAGRRRRHRRRLGLVVGRERRGLLLGGGRLADGPELRLGVGLRLRAGG